MSKNIKYWGQNTQNSLDIYMSDNDKINTSLIKAIIIIKKAACKVNFSYNLISKNIYYAIDKSCNFLLENYKLILRELLVYQYKMQHI